MFCLIIPIIYKKYYYIGSILPWSHESPLGISNCEAAVNASEENASGQNEH